MKLTSAAGLLIGAITMLPSCIYNNKAFYKSDRYTVYPDRVEQGIHTAIALSSREMVSDYKSSSAYIDPVIEFKFSINGRDDELPFGVNHEANIYPETDSAVVLNIVFGQKAVLGKDADASKPLPQNSKVRFRVDLSSVLGAIREKGFYDDLQGNRIYKEDFKGLYIAGDTYPLSWDFENIPGNPMLRMEDPDGDGIYENELTFNVFDPSVHTSASWKLANDISQFPRFESSSLLLEALYNMSLDEMVMLMEEDGTFRTGKEWAGVWTRDISYATLLSLAFLDPQRCMTSLMQKVSGNRIVQDTGTGGAWPVSSDRVVWALAAWEIYKVTGDKEWLAKVFQIVTSSLDTDSKTIVDPATGLIRGESSFLDWRKQTYPVWMEPADIGGSLNLGTNAAYCQVLGVTGMMAQELGITDIWSFRAEKLKVSINENLWLEEKGYFGQYLYGRNFRSLSPRSEALGEAFAILFDIATEERKHKVLKNTPVTPYGITCIYPQIPGIPPYHNNGIWPFVQAFWTIANADQKNTVAVEAGLASVIRPAALFLTNKENFVAENGDFAGTEINSDRQLWSVAAMLAMHHRILLGISFEKDRMVFSPVIPESFSDTYSLNGFKYRKGSFEITVKGWGDGIATFEIDGSESDDHFIPASMEGNHTVEIVMNRRTERHGYKSAGNNFAPETPVLSDKKGILSWSRANGATEYMLFMNGKPAVKTTDTVYRETDTSRLAEFQVMAIDDHGVESFLSNPLLLAGKDNIITAEAEDFNISGENIIKGFSGTGYVRFRVMDYPGQDNRNGTDTNRKVQPGINEQSYTLNSWKDEGELRLKIKAGAGIYVLQMRYANGTGPVNTDNNCGIRSLFVNGLYAGSVVFPQRGRDEWSDWGNTFPQQIQLREGENILTIGYEPFNRNMDGEINEFLLDRISLVRYD
jgi:hypothetical protein